MRMVRSSEVLRLQAEIGRMQGRSARARVLPVSESLSPLFPEGGLRAGSGYTVDDSPALLLALLAEASRAGSWCAVVGLPDLSCEAAEAAGVDLERLVLVPEAGKRWAAVLSALAEVIPLIAVRPRGGLRTSEQERLGARLRDRGGVVLSTAPWPLADAELRLHDPRWSGLGHGHGLLRERSVTITAVGRRIPHPRRVSVLLPGPHGTAVGMPRASLSLVAG